MSILRIGAFLFLGFSVYLASFAAASSNDATTQAVFKNYAKFLNDVSDRRSRIAYTPYPVSPVHGLQQGLVHVSTGTAAFGRIDMVVDAAMPLVVRRVYSSGRADAGDFGVGGWRLSLLEHLEETPDGTLLYTYGNGRTLALKGESHALGPLDAVTSDVLDVTVRSDRASVTTRTGLRKAFTRHGSRFLLTTVTDRFGNSVRLLYDDDDRLARLESSDSGFVELARNAAGFIHTATDQTGRVVRYGYDDGGSLRHVMDLRGEVWRYSYLSNGLLENATTPSGLVDVALTYDSENRVQSSAINGFTHQYTYGDGKTDARDVFGVTSYRAGKSGITHSVTNAIGTRTEIGTDRFGRPIKLLRNGRQLASVAYGSGDEGPSQPSVLNATLDDASFEVVYDEAGRALRLASQDRSLFDVERYAFGLTPAKVTGANGTVIAADFDRRGDLAHMDFADGARWEFVRDGAQWRISNDKTSAELAFSPTGHVESVSVGEKHSARYWYDEGGFRQRTEASDGARVTYNYDASGSLIYTETWFEGQPKEGFTYLPNEFNAVTEIQTTKGRSVKLSYGTDGLPFELTSDGIADHTFRHDRLGRLTTIDRDGMESITYEYEAGEADIVLQHDSRSATIYSQHRDPVEFGSRFDTWMSRILPADFGVLTFSHSTREIQLPFDWKTWHPLSAMQHSLASMELGALLSDSPDFASFSVPSSRLFVPRELWSVNCCWCGCPFSEYDCQIP